MKNSPMMIRKLVIPVPELFKTRDIFKCLACHYNFILIISSEAIFSILGIRILKYD